MKPKIIEKRDWSAAEVRGVCVRNNLYTCGTNEEYSRMLEQVDELSPSTENIYIIAKDIAEHSEYETISNVMCILANSAVLTTYKIEGE